MATFALECGNLGRSAFLRVANFLPRSAQKHGAIPGRVLLKDTDHVNEPIEILQQQNSCRLIGYGDCALSRLMNRTEKFLLREFAERIARNARYDSNSITYKGIPGPNG